MLSLPLAKLSTASDAGPEDQTFQWSHDLQDIYVVLDTYRMGASSRCLMKVIKGTEVRQFIELDRMIADSIQLTQAMQERGIELKSDQLPISAIVRSPLLAIRWQLPDKKVRRIQLKFRTHGDFDSVHKQLQQLGLEMSSPRDARAKAPNNAKCASVSPLKVTQTPVSAFPTTTSNGPSCPPSRLAELSHRPFTATNAPTSVEAQIQEASHIRPVSAVSHNINSRREPVDPLVPPEYFQRPATAVLPCGVSNFTESPGHAFQETPNDRPNTALLFDRPDTAESCLPPRRELPFQRSNLTGSAGSDASRPSSRLGTGNMAPPPLPARVVNLRPSSSKSMYQEPGFPEMRQPSFVLGAQSSRQGAIETSRTPTLEQGPVASYGERTFEQQENRPLSSSGSNNSPQTYKRAATSGVPTKRPLSALSSSSGNRRQSESPKAHHTPPTSDIAVDATAHVRIDNPFDKNANPSLASYAAQPAEQRRNVLNEFLFHHLQDPDFLTMVEDMEAAWARVMLGT